MTRHVHAFANLGKNIGLQHVPLNDALQRALEVGIPVLTEK